ncbi:GntR family transcriptional regulator [Candidatus Bipolaricaulota bacterium]
MTNKSDWTLDMDAGPIFEQISKNVRRLLARGDLEPGDKLPSARDLAQLLSINPNTVVHAYGQLESHGIIEKRRGMGTFVREDAPVAKLRKEMMQGAATEYAKESRGLKASLVEASATLKEVWDAG